MADAFVMFIKDNKDGTIDIEDENQELLITLTCTIDEAQDYVKNILIAMFSGGDDAEEEE